MKSKECKNCGSTKFHKVEQNWKCEYCGTLYLDPQKESVPRQNPNPNLHSKKRSLIIFSVLPIIILFVIGFVTSSSTNNNSNEPIDVLPSTSRSDDGFPGKWTKEIYEEIRIATELYDADSEKYSFKGGASYEELEKLVGPPDRVTSWEKEKYGMPPRSTATWDQTKDGEYANASVTITYDKQTKMITDKSRY